MVMQKRIEEKVRQAFAPTLCELVNESHRHATGPGAESHFKLTLVSPAFAGKPLVARHRAVYEVLNTELQGGVHALTLQLFTPEEWQKNGQVHPSPNCQGGSKH